MEEFSSVLLQGKLYFGPVPTQSQLRIMQSHRITCLVNCMTVNESHRFPYEVPPESLGMNVYRFSIRDQTAPWNTTYFFRFLLMMIDQLQQKPDLRIYIHCRGGHGRSALVAGCLYLLMTNLRIRGDACIDKLTQAHHHRKNLNPKYLTQKCPVAGCQRKYLENIHERYLRYMSSIQSPDSTPSTSTFIPPSIPS